MNKYLLILSVVLASKLSTTQADSVEFDIAKAKRYQAFGQSDMKELEVMFFSVLKNMPSSPDLDLLTRQGFAFKTLQQDTFVLYDTSDRGWGYFYINPKVKELAMVQIPHQFHDKLTGEIGQKLFQLGKIHSLVVNNAHRYPDDETAPPADWAHISLSPLNAFTRAFIALHPDAKIFQLHGYSKEKRKNIRTRNADMIISSGQRWPQPLMIDTYTCLQKNKNWKILRYPLESDELGGITNQQGKLLRLLGSRNFIHLELAFETRRSLVETTSVLESFHACITQLPKNSDD